MTSKEKGYLKKSACFTDIHWGRKNNSELHNQDCMRYIDWFCEEVKKDKNVDHIIFLGDWYQNRSSINGLTLKYSYEAAKKLNSLGLPIYAIVGNHDLYYRNNRKIFTTYSLESLENFIFVDSKPTVFPELGENGSLVCPFLFEHEYPNLVEFMDIPVWYGHFEFKGFVLTGESFKKEHGPDPEDFSKPKKIFSGHFHKRQSLKNVHYIGNTFPADFSDANDNERGYATYEYDTDTLTYYNWDECPMYINCNLSDVVENNVVVPDGARVNCNVDIQIDYDESVALKNTITEKHNLREFNLIEKINFHDVDTSDVDTNTDNRSTTEIVVSLLGKIDEPNINNEKLQNIYKEL